MVDKPHDVWLRVKEMGWEKIGILYVPPSVMATWSHLLHSVIYLSCLVLAELPTCSRRQAGPPQDAKISCWGTVQSLGPLWACNNWEFTVLNNWFLNTKVKILVSFPILPVIPNVRFMSKQTTCSQEAHISISNKYMTSFSTRLEVRKKINIYVWVLHCNLTILPP